MIFRYFIIVFGLLSISELNAQNLQFSQVVIVSNTDQTVPVGKVWKIESYQQQQIGFGTSSPTTSCGDLSRPRPYVIDGLNYNDIKGTGWGSGSILYAAGNTFPIWLKAGQTCRTTCSGDFLSILEFNIVP
jgi:hypothetical protein